MKIKYKDLPNGPNSISFTPNPNLKLLVWFAMNFNKEESICGGDEKPMTGPDSLNFSSCSTSSNKNESFNCEAGLSELWRDEEGKIWKTDNEGVGA